MALAKSKWGKKLAGVIAAVALALALLFGGNFAVSEQTSFNTTAPVVADGGGNGQPSGGG